MASLSTSMISTLSKVSPIFQWRNRRRPGHRPVWSLRIPKSNVCDFINRSQTDRTANGRIIINNIRLALETHILQLMEGEKELYMKTPRSLTTSVICMELSGLPVSKDNCRGGAYLLLGLPSRLLDRSLSYSNHTTWQLWTGRHPVYLSQGQGWTTIHLQ